MKMDSISTSLTPPSTVNTSSSLLLLQFINLMGNGTNFKEKNIDRQLGNEAIQLTKKSNISITKSNMDKICCMAECGLNIDQIAQNQRNSSSNPDYDVYQPLDYEDPYFRVGSTRIIGGTDVLITKIPWQVSFQRSRGYFSKYQHFCGGSIIHPQWVVTAAHCFAWIRSNPIKSKELYAVRMVSGTSTSVNNIYFFSWDREQISQLDTVIKYPLYWKNSPRHDLALVKLSQPIVMYPNSLVNSICLPFPNQNVDGVVTVSGFGRTSESGKQAKTLQWVNVTIRSESECSKVYDRTYIAKNMVCAGNYKKDSCQGDSGGPLFQFNPDIGRILLQGIVSYGIGCGRKEFPGIYTRVSYYVDWIKKTIIENSDNQLFNHLHQSLSSFENYFYNDYDKHDFARGS